MKKFINPLLRLGTAVALLSVIYFQNKELNQLRNKPDTVVGGDIQKAEIIDSLQSELFNEQTINGRYELTFDHLKEVNPKLGKQMEEWMNHETE